MVDNPAIADLLVQKITARLITLAQLPSCDSILGGSAAQFAPA